MNVSIGKARRSRLSPRRRAQGVGLPHRGLRAADSGRGPGPAAYHLAVARSLYMRGRMSDGPSYAAPVPIGGVMEGGTVWQVIASDNPGFAKGDIVLSRAGWQTHAIYDGKGIAKIVANFGPYSTVVGVPGLVGI